MERAPLSEKEHSVTPLVNQSGPSLGDIKSLFKSYCCETEQQRRRRPASSAPSDLWSKHIILANRTPSCIGVSQVESATAVCYGVVCTD